MSENQKGLIKLCKLCEEPLLKVVLAFSNRIAIEEGYCCWMCMKEGQPTTLYGVGVSENDDYVNQPPRENSLFYSVPHYFRGNGIKGLNMDNKGMARIK